MPADELDEPPFDVAEPVAGSELAAAEVLGADVLGEPTVVGADVDLVAAPDVDPVELCAADVVEGAEPVEESDCPESDCPESDCPESERDVVNDAWGAADAPVLELEAPVEAGDVAAGAAGVVPAEVPVPVGGAELAPGGAADVESSLAVEDELDGGTAVESGAALLEVDGLPVNEGVALGPGTSTWIFGGAPSGCGITMIGPTRTGPTCTGPTVTGEGNPSAAAEGLAEDVASGGAAELADGSGNVCCEAGTPSAVRFVEGRVVTLVSGADELGSSLGRDLGGSIGTTETLGGSALEDGAIVGLELDSGRAAVGFLCCRVGVPPLADSGEGAVLLDGTPAVLAVVDGTAAGGGAAMSGSGG